MKSFSISPATAKTVPGGQVTFKGTAVWSDGTTTVPRVIWSTNGGAITTSGTYLAPKANGSYRVVGYMMETGKQDTSWVTVSSSTSSPSIVSVSLTPSQTSLAPGGTRQFTLTATYSNGTTGSPSGVWSATGGTISSSGLYTAGNSTGTYRVIVQPSGSTRKDTATVSITAPTVTKLVLAPGSPTLDPGGTTQFSTAVTWSDGQSRPVTLAYSATGGSITSSGLYTAGSVAGSYSVKVTCSGCTVSATTPVTIASASSTSLTLAPTNRPSDHTTLFDLNLTSRQIGWSFSQKWLSTTYLLEVADAAAPRSRDRGLEFVFPAGFSDLTSPARAATTFGASRELYVAYWLKMSRPWQYHTSAVNKLFFISTNGSSTLGNEVVVALRGLSEGSAQIEVGVQTPANTGTGTKNGYFLANVSQPGFSLGTWHLIEVRAVQNTGGAANGRLTWWVDGQMVGNHGTVRFSSTGDGYFNGLVLDPNWGGQGSPPKAQRDWIRIDHLLVTRK